MPAHAVLHRTSVEKLLSAPLRSGGQTSRTQTIYLAPVIAASSPSATLEVEVYRLHDGRRFIAKVALAKALNLKSEGGNAFLRTVTRKGVRSAISDELWNKIENPITFKYLDTDPEGGQKEAPPMATRRQP